ncbi:hypothetical protein I79_025908 [Cricetulus griseus]|uniref:Uncharacterized protein n=1 Tax=Cricetulus griseus TaxID=10029 RepID=G3IPJ6_CRIGR|nr:hypothetical protein I79_025908 [Cricetulus griseus]
MIDRPDMERWGRGYTDVNGSMCKGGKTSRSHYTGGSTKANQLLIHSLWPPVTYPGLCYRIL